MQTKKLINIFFILLGIFIPAWIIWKNIFPTVKTETNLRDYRYYERNIILKKEIGDQGYLVFPCKEEYRFNEVKLEINFKNKIVQNYNIPCQKGYESMLFPSGEPLASQEELKKLLWSENPSDFPNGSLVSNNETVYFITRGKYFPISSEVDFIKLGFRWENVKPMDSDELAQFEKGEKLYNFSSHPDGTVLKDPEGNFFLVWDRERRPIPKKEWLAKTWPGYNWVAVETELIGLPGSCRPSIGEKQLVCTYQDEPGIRGGTYIFNLKEAEDKKIEKVEVSLKTDISKDQEHSLRMFLGKIKHRLITRLNRENAIY